MIDLETYLIDSAPTFEEGAKYLKTKYNSNKDRFLGRYLDEQRDYLQAMNIKNYEEIYNFYIKLFDLVNPFTYLEAFSIKDSSFRATVFSVINVPEMIENLGSTRIKTEGIELVNKVYNKEKNIFENIIFNQVYELHEVNGDKLDITEEKLYAIKCWCTSTNKEHWLWIDSEEGEKKDPLSAIASTCKYYESMKGKIKHIIRQGDVFIFEMNEDIIPSEDDKIINFTKNEYFKLLKSQS